MKASLSSLFIVLSCAVHAQDILILGEVHDNPDHHAIQAEKVAALMPKAVVYEMLTPKQADGVILTNVGDPGALEKELKWHGSGWPDFSLYSPIFEASPNAKVYGAGLPREEARAAVSGGISEIFGEESEAYGLDQPLPQHEQEKREALQLSAHCDALPEEMLPGMVEVQRLRDAKLARAVKRALDETGGPVALITGNGHARKDWGVPFFLQQVLPDADVSVLGQTEDNIPLAGGFDSVISSPAVDRPDPCDAFK